MRATHVAKFTLIPNENYTTVTWSMTGTNNFIGKLMSLAMNCDAMIGGQFEKGLASMRNVAELR